MAILKKMMKKIILKIIFMKTISINQMKILIMMKRKFKRMIIYINQKKLI